MGWPRLCSNAVFVAEGTAPSAQCLQARVPTHHVEAEVQKAEEVVELLKEESTLVETMNASLAAEEIIGASRAVLHTASADLQSYVDALKRDISPSHSQSASASTRFETQQQLALLVEKLVAGRYSLCDLRSPPSPHLCVAFSVALRPSSP